MTTQTLAVSGDLPTAGVIIALALALLSLGLMGWEMLFHRGKSWLVVLTGIAAAVLLLLAVLRPVRVSSRVSHVGPRIVVLGDRSVSMQLPSEAGTRDEALKQALDDLTAAAPHARLTVLGFGSGEASPLQLESTHARSDLVAGLNSLRLTLEEKPSAVVVISDGRLDRPGPERVREEIEALSELRGTPIHTVQVAQRSPADASIRAVRTAGVAVAHQPFNLSVVVGCSGAIACGELPITVRELVERGSPVTLSQGTAKLVDGAATVELSLTLEQAGPRVVEIAIDVPSGDEIPDNNRRYLTFDVTRDRVRILHIAGRPTYDVRALRQWLKSDASLDVVAFFILRSLSDDVGATPDELALIRFPVDELFTEHLASFDAVVLQDFNADPYGLSPYLRNLAHYVERGGGLIMVGGLNAFSTGGYAATPLERALPVGLLGTAGDAIDNEPFVPRFTLAGRETPVLEGLRALVGERIPQMSGANVVDAPRPGTVVLWEHPKRKTSTGEAMPVLALGEHGNGRSLALAIDDTHKLAFSESAARHAGRGYGALWDALLGWLMRDPRYEPARVDLLEPCRAGQPTRLQVRTVPAIQGRLELMLLTLGSTIDPRPIVVDAEQRGSSPVEVTLPPLEPGGYAARVRVGDGPWTRRDFACERGGDEWADSRPDPNRMAELARATGGRATGWKDAGSIKFPDATEITAERHVWPLAPPWLWTMAAALALGLHWIARRRFGLA